MKRRDFMKGAAAGVAVASLSSIGGRGVNMLAQSPSKRAMDQLMGSSDNILVLIQLDGGNDGLNTIIPIENAEYYNQRESIAISKSNALPLNDTLGWHPALGGLRDLYDAEKLTVVQGVTYPNPNRSHFRGTDIWMTASDSDVFLSSGWLGRYLEPKYPDFPEVLPDDPLAIQIGSKVSLAFNSDAGKMAVTFRDPDEFYRLVGGVDPENPDLLTPDTVAGDELTFVRTIHDASQTYSERVHDASEAGSNAVEYPGDNNPAQNQLAQSLKIVARLISGGLQTRLYLVSLRGFDTHAQQDAIHTGLLTQLSDAVKAFMDDMDQQNLGDKVAGMTFSEFGRRVQENGSAGTDHGAAAPLLVFGNRVLGKRVHGQDPDLGNLDERGDLLMQFDFRSVYASVLAQWFGEADNDIQSVLLGEWSRIPIFREDDVTSVNNPNGDPVFELRHTPNPLNTEGAIHYSLPIPTHARITLYDVHGRKIAVLFAGEQAAGPHTLRLDARRLTPGSYFYRIEAGSQSATQMLQVVR